MKRIKLLRLSLAAVFAMAGILAANAQATSVHPAKKEKETKKLPAQPSDCPYSSTGGKLKAVVTAENKSKLAEDVLHALVFPTGELTNCAGVWSYAEHESEISSEERALAEEAIEQALQPGDAVYTFAWKAKAKGTKPKKFDTLGIADHGEVLFEPTSSLDPYEELNELEDPPTVKSDDFVILNPLGRVVFGIKLRYEAEWVAGNQVAGSWRVVEVEQLQPFLSLYRTGYKIVFERFQAGGEKCWEVEIEFKGYYLGIQLGSKKRLYTLCPSGSLTWR